MEDSSFDVATLGSFNSFEPFWMSMGRQPGEKGGDNPGPGQHKPPASETGKGPEER